MQGLTCRSDIPKLGGYPAVPWVAGGLSRREVHLYRLVPAGARAGHAKGTASKWLPSESPSARLEALRQRLARARLEVTGGPPVVRIQPERRSREVPRGWLSIPPGEG